MVSRVVRARRSESWPEYVWDALKKFGFELYHTWRWELATSVVMACVSYGITVYDDPQAWKNLVVSIDAACYVLGGFAVLHIVRTPFLIHKHTLKQERVPESWQFGIFGACAFVLLCFGAFRTAAVVKDRFIPALKVTLPSGNVVAKDIEIAELRKQIPRGPVYVASSSHCNPLSPKGRVLSRQNIAAMVQIFQAAGKGRVEIVPINTEEPYNLANQLTLAFYQGGWFIGDPVPATLMASPTPMGPLTIMYRDFNDTDHTFVERAFKAVNLKYEARFSPHDMTPNVNVTIYILDE
jgi:hypothetical protein